MVININTIGAEYKNVISAFKKRADVQSGKALGYRKNQDPNGELRVEDTPRSIGYGLATTGWCVSASQALLFDPIFKIFLQDRGAQAKLVSIDIREQFYGFCYSGSANKWHTAILVCDSGFNFIIDITCAQFGNDYVHKDIWDFGTWEKTFRSATDKHNIVDFKGNSITTMGVYMGDKPMFVESVDVVHALQNITTITDTDRKTLADFLLKTMDVLNKKLSVGNVNKFDYDYLSKITELLRELDFDTEKEQYSVLRFANKKTALKWLENFLKGGCITQQFMVLSNTIEENCQYYGIDPSCVNIESQKDETFIVFSFKDVDGTKIDFIKNANTLLNYGIRLIVDNKKGVYNGGTRLSRTVEGLERKTNTFIVECTY